ncbi:hypothetical protein BX592_105221 [Paraburkholderia rhizosphaerae]|uniref:Uncharacterized protein n=1 Tax=Paraburkholderia rhizosphaerae TaxID=480658 RepID=A0A4R8LWL3_9BURK|nr:hypothetical protein BX592_105221 [Paraburkholderia rhizosphaerae]
MLPAGRTAQAATFISPVIGLVRSRFVLQKMHRGAWRDATRLIEVARFQFDRLAAVALQHALRGGLNAWAIRFE